MLTRYYTSLQTSRWHTYTFFKTWRMVGYSKLFDLHYSIWFFTHLRHYVMHKHTKCHYFCSIILTLIYQVSLSISDWRLSVDLCINRGLYIDVLRRSLMVTKSEEFLVIRGYQLYSFQILFRASTDFCDFQMFWYIEGT